MVPTAEQFDLVVIGGGPGGYAAALYGASAGLNVAMVEKDKVGRHLPAPGLHPGQGVPRDGLGVPHVAGAKEFGIDAGAAAPSTSRVTQARKQEVVDS